MSYSMLCFNSTIVRLKVICYFFYNIANFLFQFYDSTIKSAGYISEFKRGYSFNSTIVRLKAPPHKKKRPGRRGFQFYDSTIKRAAPHTVRASPPWSFNSTIVRLKDSHILTIRPRALKCFNSTIVRLKDGWRTLTRAPRKRFNSTIVRLKDECGCQPAAILRAVSILR